MHGHLSKHQIIVILDVPFCRPKLQILNVVFYIYTCCFSIRFYLLFIIFIPILPKSDNQCIYVVTLKPSQQDVMVDGIKCCGQVEQGEDRQVAVIDCIRL